MSLFFRILIETSGINPFIDFWKLDLHFHKSYAVQYIKIRCTCWLLIGHLKCNIWHYDDHMYMLLDCKVLKKKILNVRSNLTLAVETSPVWYNYFPDWPMGITFRCSFWMPQVKRGDNRKGWNIMPVNNPLSILHHENIGIIQLEYRIQTNSPFYTHSNYILYF